MKLFKHYLSALAVTTALLAPTFYTADVMALTAAEREERQNAKTKVPSPTVGKKVQRAFELYGEEDVNGALEILLDTDASKDYDKAFLNKFIGNLYATQDGKAELAIKHMLLAYEGDQLNYKEQAEVIRILAQLYMMQKQYQNAIDFYKEWMSFTGEQDAKTYVYIANGYYELKQLDKVIEPANKSIELGKKDDERDVTPYILKLASYYERKMYPETVKMGETLVKFWPEEKKYWTQLGMFYVLVEDYARSLSTMEIAYKQGYLDKESQFKTLAQMYSQQENPIKAAIIQEKYLKLGVIEKNEQNLKRLANYYLAAKEMVKAAEYFGEAADIGGDPNMYRRQGESFFQAQKYAQAAKALQKSLDKNLPESKRGSVLISLMQSYFYQGKYKEAYAELEKAAKVDSSKRQAASWRQYIKDKAKFHGVTI